MSVMDQDRPTRTRRSFTEEFKRDAVALVLDQGHRIVDVASDLGIGDRTLGSWARQARIDRGDRVVPLPRTGPGSESCPSSRLDRQRGQFTDPILHCHERRALAPSTGSP